MEHITITDSSKQLHVQKSYIDESTFSQVSLQRVAFNDVTLAGSTIVNANLSDLQVEGAQLGGARFKNIGMPPVGHPFYKEGARQRPVRFEHCDLNGTVFIECNLQGAEINSSDTSGMKTNGILVEDLLKAFHSR